MSAFLIRVIEDVIEFAKANFDKLVLALIFVGMVALTIHLIHDVLAIQTPSTAMIGTDFVGWAEIQAGIVLGALLALITGKSRDKDSEK